jgi:16S rRNA (uracil1498-N3)-methyltransferase
MAERFYVNSPLGMGPVEIAGSEAHHLATVCRLRSGDAVCLFNGDGREYPAEVVSVARKQVLLRILAVREPVRELGFRVEAAVALPKGDRAQFLVEKLTELGVSAFTPLQTARGVVRPREAKLEKLHRYVIESSKQCGRNCLMAVAPLTALPDLLRRPDLPPHRVLAHPSDGGEAPLPQKGTQNRDMIFAVGPEGGFTDEEVTLARTEGLQVRGLGPRILRIETAAIALATLAAG